MILEIIVFLLYVVYVGFVSGLLLYKMFLEKVLPGLASLLLFSLTFSWAIGVVFSYVLLLLNLPFSRLGLVVFSTLINAMFLYNMRSKRKGNSHLTRA